MKEKGALIFWFSFCGVDKTLSTHISTLGITFRSISNLSMLLFRIILLLLYTRTTMGFFGKLFGMSKTNYAGLTVMGEESIMSKKEHGTSATPVQANLRWKCDNKTADRICNFNRHFAEHSGYFRGTEFLKETYSASPENPVKFYDSNTGKLLYTAPVGRSWDKFVRESESHGWPSFRDQETNWENVRILPGGEAVSVDGTHLGHNLPDGKGNRHCINLVSVAAQPPQE